MIYVIAVLETEPSETARVIAAADPLISATQAEAGCISYELHADVRQPNRLVFVETWESRDHLEDHFKTPHIAAFGAAISGAVLKQRLEIVDAADVEVS
ncbi:quinol monooxygenase YgiN [Rhizobium sp. SG_E_25_P2]|jgi:quinol monooxygenase YgiN|uniref:putative quinol monooxygenase n=1 Tax=Rhizobium sp. SG_E_25_P2 TaxID=2879942 RepID=UPI00247667E6|nr:putative quinol monooxygenase [Rhizobium sp. SG_E_25_P2]MDH6265707.1 quinol monooxygenase YgiN [Rhizobium sp. SG_E_25_P2]